MASWEYSPRYDKWIYWYPKPRLPAMILPEMICHCELVSCNRRAIVNLIKMNRKPIAEEILEIGLSGSMKLQNFGHGF